MISDDAYKALEEAVGPENVSREPGVLDGYAWQTHLNSDPDIWLPRPEAVVLPASTEEVQAVVRACNEHGVKFKAFSMGWAAQAGPSMDGVIQIDLRRMNRILKIDDKNMYAVIEPYVSGAQLQAEAMKAGLNTHMIGAGAGASPLASATSFYGMGWDGVYMSSSARNLLGVEWVLPSGELLRLGSKGSGDNWFNADGPGPSLRGIMRGWAGTVGSLGVFTKCALKLYNWPGPPQPEILGTLLDAQSEAPQQLKLFMCVFPDWERYTDAVYKVGEAEIGYIQGKNAVGLLLGVLVPHLLKRISITPMVKKALRALHHEFVIVLAADTQNGLNYQQETLSEIVRGEQGVLLDIEKIPPLYKVMMWGLIRSSLQPLTFRALGNYNLGFGVDECFDSQVLAGKLAEGIKENWIAKDAMLDDFANNSWTLIYENGMWSHCEELFMFDHRNRKHAEALSDITMDFLQASMDNFLSPGIVGVDPVARKMFSPLQCDYNLWQKKILEAMDKGDVSDATFYTGEGD